MQGCVKRPSTVGWIMVEFCKPQKFIFRFWNDTNVQFVYWKCLSNFWLNREILGIRGDLRRYICHICVKTYGYVYRKKRTQFYRQFPRVYFCWYLLFFPRSLIVLNIETSEKVFFILWFDFMWMEYWNLPNWIAKSNIWWWGRVYNVWL